MSEEGVADDGRWILMMRRTDMFGDGFVLGEFEDGTGLGLVAMLVRRRVVGRARRRPRRAFPLGASRT